VNPSSRPLYFLHIGKNAGTSMANILKRYIPKKYIAPMTVMPQLESALLSGKDLSGYRLFHGHFGHTLPNCLQQAPYIATMLRAPLLRTLSHYNYRTHSGHRATLDMAMSEEARWVRDVLGDFVAATSGGYMACKQCSTMNRCAVTCATSKSATSPSSSI